MSTSLLDRILEDVKPEYVGEGRKAVGFARMGEGLVSYEQAVCYAAATYAAALVKLPNEHLEALAAQLHALTKPTAITNEWQWFFLALGHSGPLIGFATADEVARILSGAPERAPIVLVSRQQIEQELAKRGIKPLQPGEEIVILDERTGERIVVMYDGDARLQAE